MRTVGLLLAILALGVFFVAEGVEAFQVTEIKVAEQTTLFAVESMDRCNLPGFEDSNKARCYEYTVTKADGKKGLSGIAKKFSTKERVLTVDDLLKISANRYIDEREIPENLKGYSGPPWNKTSRDWIFPGDKIILPFVLESEAERVENEKALTFFRKENENLRKELVRPASLIQAVLFWGLAVIILGAVISLIFLRRVRNGGNDEYPI